MTLTDANFASKDEIRRLFDQISQGYDCPETRYYPFSADYMMGLAKPKTGERVLDVATGTATVAIAAAQYLRASGRVHAIDFSEGMLKKAQHNIDKHALSNIDVHTMDAENIEFRSNYFDLICCGFGLAYCADPAQTLANWCRVLKPGGRIVFSSFAEPAFMPMLAKFHQAIDTLGTTTKRITHTRLSRSDSCLSMIDDSLFSKKQVTTKQHGIHLQDANQWWSIVTNSDLRYYLNALTPQQQAQLRLEQDQYLDTLKNELGIWLDVEVIYTQLEKHS